ncbi:Glycoside hydrolase family 18, catalytic domain [Sesbania bispinosa]|nr:Glycoside hydrolase family 18, catalytic domain [Sesbania bispinosa]
MAPKRQALILIVLSLLTINTSEATTGGIAIYWGQNNGDGTLTSTCDTGNYEIVLLSFLTTFGCGRTPQWNFAGHCGDWSPCTKLQPEIEHCQQKGIKVFLSLGGASGSYSLCSTEDAKEVANYLFSNFLTGQSGPLGSVTLDGIDFDIEGGSNLYWDDLAKELDALRQTNNYFYLSAAPQCPIPDYYLDKAIKTGIFDYVFVQFYNNPPCQYSDGNTGPLFQSWDAWTSLVLTNNTVFMGLPASTDAALSGGYIPPQVLISEVLPYIKQTPNYGGIMLWSRFQDVTNHYSDQIKDYVPQYVLRFVKTVSNAISDCVSAALHRFLPSPKPY